MEALRTEQSTPQRDLCCDFMSFLFWSRTQTHLWHLQTNNEALHKVLNTYYDEVITLADRFMEVYLGHYPKKKETIMFHEMGIPYQPLASASPRDHFVAVSKQVDIIRQVYSGKPSLCNVLDDMDEFVNKLLYLITLS